MEGCPFVELSDTAWDIATFLRAIFYYDFFEPFPAPTTFSILTSILRMSHKYDVGVLHKRALSRPPAWMEDDQHVAIVGLARKISADWILPSAFYRMCQTAEEHHVMTTAHLEDSHKAHFVQDCNMAREENYRLVIKRAHYDPEVVSTMPLELWREADWVRLCECDKCFAVMRRAHQVARQALWDKLPGIFGLPAWAELEKMKEEALA
ncbi:hypothetical protein DFH06DRAFT_1317769 [Mycena polygramma]|nr:hypothetical protein DFH06DRAFT_1317769 [Mycena polygramma]